LALHNEIEFENDICNHLAAHGWLYQVDDAQGYDTERALFPAVIQAWVQETQPHAWDALSKVHGAGALTVLLDRLRKFLDDRGTLEALRTQLDIMGLKTPIKLAQFKPALAMNPELEARYAANRLRVVRQARTNHNDVIDLVLFLNGIPVATVELKTEFTQGINEAVTQYCEARHPKPKGKPFAEPLPDFPRGALVPTLAQNWHTARLAMHAANRCTRRHGEHRPTWQLLAGADPPSRLPRPEQRL
jgi:type I restriction enzyme R subunit